MKVSTMQMIMEIFNDVDEVKNMLNIYNDNSDEEVKKLLNSLKSLNSYYSCKVATNEELYKFAGSVDNLIKIMEVCTHDFSYALAEDEYLRNFLKNSDDLVKVIKICENPVLCYIASCARTLEYAGNIENLIKILNGSIDFSKELLFKEYDEYNRDFVYRVILPLEHIQKLILFHIEKFKNINVKEVKHDENISQIKSFQEMKSYVESLENEYGNDKDIKLNDKVFSYIPGISKINK